MLRRDFFTNIVVGPAAARLAGSQAPQPSGGVVFERQSAEPLHKGKVLLAVQAHSDDIPLFAAGTVAKLVQDGYTGYLVRATNDDMGDAPGLGTPGTIGEHVLGNERDNAKLVPILGLKGKFDLNYSNHRMGDVAFNELLCRLIFLIRLLKVDTVVSWDPWAHDEENPDHHMTARAVEAACWMAGRAHDYPEQLAAGLTVHAVTDRYYYARRPEITRVVDISQVIDKKVEANRANVAKGPAGTTDRACGPSWPHAGCGCRCSATTMRQPTATTSRSSCSRAAASSDGSTASSTPRRSTMSDPGRTCQAQARRWRSTSRRTRSRYDRRKEEGDRKQIDPDTIAAGSGKLPVIQRFKDSTIQRFKD